MHMKTKISQIKLCLYLSMGERPGGQGMLEYWEFVVSSIYFHLLQELSSKYLCGACVDENLRVAVIEDSVVVP